MITEPSLHPALHKAIPLLSQSGLDDGNQESLSEDTEEAGDSVIFASPPSLTVSPKTLLFLWCHDIFKIRHFLTPCDPIQITNQEDKGK